MKTIIKIVVVLVILVAVALAIGVMWVDRIAKVGVERGATYALGVKTTLDRADVGLLSGHFAMSGLNVANPSGFKTAHFLDLENGSVSVSLGSLTADTVELPALLLNGIDMNLERSGADSNYKVILKNLEKFESAEPKKDEAGSSKKFVIRKVEVTDVNVHVDLLPIGGEATRLEVPIDRIELTDLGSGSDGGVVLSELSAILVKAILTAIVEQSGGKLPADLLGDLESSLAKLSGEGLESLKASAGDLQKAASDALEKLGEGGGEAGKNLEKKANEAIEKGLGDLLGGKKKKE